MTQNIAITRKAEDPKTGMTIAELFAFTQDALKHDIDPRTPAKVRVGWNGQITKISTGERA